MKAFEFRLEPALRWRSMQLRLEREAVARAAGQIAAIQNELHARYAELRAGGTELVAAGSVAFASWSAYVERCRRRIRILNDQLPVARKALAAQTHKMVEAHQRLRVLENLRSGDRAEWEGELNRETEAFAGEAYLAGMVRDSRAAP